MSISQKKANQLLPSVCDQGDGEMFSRRPLRAYLFETLLFLTVVTFLFQVGYIFLPVYDSDYPPEPVGDYDNHAEDLSLEGVVHVAERDVESEELEKEIEIEAPKYRLRKQQFAAEAAAKAGKEKSADANPPQKAAQQQNQPQNAEQPKPPVQQPAEQPKVPAQQPAEQPKAPAPVHRRHEDEEAMYDCHMSVLVLGGMKIVEQWSELTTLVKFLKRHTINEGVTYRGPINCHEHKCTIDLTFSSNFTSQMPGKNAVILNVAPYTLLTQMSKLLRHNNFSDKQLWILYGVETALRIHKWIKHIGDLRIHGTWSYLSDSEIHMPYAYYKPGEPTDVVYRSDSYWVKDKTGLVAWMGSNCVKEVFWPRMEYIEELAKHLHIDTYGKCGNLTCLPRLSEKCKNLMYTYKFYLAFENGECDEYISEKMWDTALQHGVVPVVYGAHKADYERLAPPNSFIYAGDFKSPKKLANYLKKLDKNPDLYAKYFEWRYHGSVVQVYPDLDPTKFCDVVPYVNKVRGGKMEKKPVSTFPWFNSCRNPIIKVFNPKDIPTLRQWEPWFSA